MNKRIGNLLDRINELEGKQGALVQQLYDCGEKSEQMEQEIKKLTQYCDAISEYYSSCGENVSEDDIVLIIQSVEKLTASYQSQGEVGVDAQDARDKRKRDQLDKLGDHDSSKKIKLDASMASRSGSSFTGQSTLPSEDTSNLNKLEQSTKLTDITGMNKPEADCVAKNVSNLLDGTDRTEIRFSRRLQYLEKILLVLQETFKVIDDSDLEKKMKCLIDVECAKRMLEVQTAKFLCIMEKQNSIQGRNKETTNDA